MLLVEFALSKEQELIQKVAKDFAEKYLEPVIDQIYEENTIPEHISRLVCRGNYPRTYVSSSVYALHLCTH